MNFGQALDSALIKNYKTFKGRACRAEWFYFLLFSVGLTILLSIIGGIVSVAGLDVEYLATLSEEQAAEYLLESPQFEYFKWISICRSFVFPPISFSYCQKTSRFGLFILLGNPIFSN